MPVIDPPFQGLDELKLDDATLNACRTEDGRAPLARFTWGEVSGLGWGFLHPRQQLALFPEKATQAGIGHPHRRHERFWLRAISPVETTLPPGRVEWTVTGRFWAGLAWRECWGREIRRVILDPDVVHSSTEPEAWD